VSERSVIEHAIAHRPQLFDEVLACARIRRSASEPAVKEPRGPVVSLVLGHRDARVGTEDSRVMSVLQRRIVVSQALG
jgi:hypothetical protein